MWDVGWLVGGWRSLKMTTAARQHCTDLPTCQHRGKVQVPSPRPAPAARPLAPGAVGEEEEERQLQEEVRGAPPVGVDDGWMDGGRGRTGQAMRTNHSIDPSLDRPIDSGPNKQTNKQNAHHGRRTSRSSASAAWAPAERKGAWRISARRVLGWYSKARRQAAPSPAPAATARARAASQEKARNGGEEAVVAVAAGCGDGERRIQAMPPMWRRKKPTWALSRVVSGRLRLSTPAPCPPPPVCGCVRLIDQVFG